MEEGRRQRERKREKVNDGGWGGEEGAGGRCRWSERENRRSDGGTETEGNGEVSPLTASRARARERERMQFKTHTGDPCVSSTHTRA